MEKTGIADFSRWTLNSPSGALPVTFISINARCDNGKVVVTWKTAREINSKRFDTERSSNGTNWKVIGSVPSAGNSQVQQAYTFIDNNPLPASARYRIVEHDINGRTEYSSILRASCSIADEIKLWPNPVNDIAWVSIYTRSNSPVLIQVYDSKGSVVLIQKANLSQGSNQLSVPVQKLAKGIYSLTLIKETGTAVMRFTKE